MTVHFVVAYLPQSNSRTQLRQSSTNLSTPDSMSTFCTALSIDICQINALQMPITNKAGILIETDSSTDFEYLSFGL